MFLSGIFLDTAQYLNVITHSSTGVVLGLLVKHVISSSVSILTITITITDRSIQIVFHFAESRHDRF